MKRIIRFCFNIFCLCLLYSIASITGAQSQTCTDKTSVYSLSITAIEKEKALVDQTSEIRCLDSLLILNYYQMEKYKQVADLSWKYFPQNNAYYFHAMHQAATYLESSTSYADSALLCSKDPAWQLFFCDSATRKSYNSVQWSKNLIVLSGLIIPGLGYALQKYNKKAVISFALTSSLCIGGMLIAVTHAPWYALAVVGPWVLRYHVGSALQARNLYQDRLQHDILMEKKRKLAGISILPKH